MLIKVNIITNLSNSNHQLHISDIYVYSHLQAQHIHIQIHIHVHSTCNTTNVMDEISSYIKMAALRVLMYGVWENFINCAIKTLKILVTIQTDGDLVGWCWDVGDRQNLKSVGSAGIFLRARLLLTYSVTTWAVRCSRAAWGLPRQLVCIVTVAF